MLLAVQTGSRAEHSMLRGRRLSGTGVVGHLVASTSENKTKWKQGRGNPEKKEKERQLLKQLTKSKVKLKEEKTHPHFTWI